MTDTQTPNTESPSTADAAPAAGATNASAGASATGNGADLQSELQQLRQRNAELNEQVLRALADAENTRRRAEEEIAKVRKFAVEALAESLDRKSTRLNSSHIQKSRMPSSA